MTATLLIPPKARFFNTSGQPLVGGFVYTFAAGTETPKTTYTTYAGNVPNENPIELDSAGEADIWLDGNYKIRLSDADDVEIWTVDGVSSFSSGSVTEYAVTTGSANNYILTPSPALTGYIAGQAFNIKINVDNTGPSTINISTLGAKSLVMPPNLPLAGGELVTDGIYRIVYDGTNFQVLNPTAAIQIIMSAQPTAPSGMLPMTGSTIAKTSGGTYNGTYFNRLYTYLWTYYDNTAAPVSAGRGATAAADFAANKNIGIPDRRGYTPYGVKAATPITTASGTAGALTVASTGTVGASGATTITTGTLPAHTHTVDARDTTTTTTPATLCNVVGPSNNTVTSGSTGGGGSHTHTGGSYTGDATSVLQPSFGIYYYISY